MNLEKSALNAEYDQERMAYQRLVQENARLEQRNETLERELQRARRLKTHKVRRRTGWRRDRWNTRSRGRTKVKTRTV